VESGVISVSNIEYLTSFDSEVCLRSRIKCAADIKTSAVCSAIALTHKVISHARICQIELMAIMGNDNDII